MKLDNRVPTSKNPGQLPRHSGRSFGQQEPEWSCRRNTQQRVALVGFWMLIGGKQQQQQNQQQPQSRRLGSNQGQQQLPPRRLRIWAIVLGQVLNRKKKIRRHQRPRHRNSERQFRTDYPGRRRP